LYACAPKSSVCNANHRCMCRSAMEFREFPSPCPSRCHTRGSRAVPVECSLKTPALRACHGAQYCCYRSGQLCQFPLGRGATHNCQSKVDPDGICREGSGNEETTCQRMPGCSLAVPRSKDDRAAHAICEPLGSKRCHPASPCFDRCRVLAGRVHPTTFPCNLFWIAYRRRTKLLP